MTKIHVYFVPGMAANSKIFNWIKLPEDRFEMHFLEWFPPKKRESLVSYAQRMAELIQHDDVVLVGVSFGGFLVQEMKPFVNPRKIIIISSVRSNTELPKRMKIARITKVYKFIPTHLFVNIEFFSKYIFKIFLIKQRIELYKKYLTVRDKNYLDWAIDQIINWDRDTIDEEVIHIHGEKDEVFPLKYIQKCIVLKGATHILILTKYRWLNKHLPKLILE